MRLPLSGQRFFSNSKANFGVGYATKAVGIAAYMTLKSHTDIFAEQRVYASRFESQHPSLKEFNDKVRAASRYSIFNVTPASDAFINTAKAGDLPKIRTMIKNAFEEAAFVSPVVVEMAAIFAAGAGHLNVVEYLFSDALYDCIKSDEYERRQCGVRAAIFAAQSGHMNVLTYLSKLPWFTLAIDYDNEVLHAAMQNNQQEVIQFINDLPSSQRYHSPHDRRPGSFA